MAILAALSRLWNAARGNTSAPIQTQNLGMPTTTAQKFAGQAAGPVGQFGIDQKKYGGGWNRVVSSNVAAIKWSPGTAVMSPAAPGSTAAQAKPGPMGGAPILGGVKTAGGVLTQQVPTSTFTQATTNQRAQRDNPGTLGTLGVLFNNGSAYDYFSVPRQVYDEFYVTSSKGRFVHRRLKGKFAFRRVR